MTDEAALPGKVLSAVNALGLAAAAAFSIRGVHNPSYVRPNEPVEPLARFWAASSAVRTLAVAGPLLGPLAVGRPVETPTLTVAGLVQLGDAALGVWQRKTDMAVAPAIMGLVHLATANRLNVYKQRHAKPTFSIGR